MLGLIDAQHRTEAAFVDHARVLADHARLLDEDTEADLWDGMHEAEAWVAPEARPVFAHAVRSIRTASGDVPRVPSMAVH